MRFPSIRRGIVVLVAATFAVISCERSPTVPPAGEAPGPAGSPGSELRWAVVACTGSLPDATLRCGVPEPDGGGDRSLAPGDGPDRLIVGGQGQYVLLESSNVAYDAGSEEFTFDVTLQNLLPQALGTLDGTSLHADGVRVFFHEGPTATGGTGTITVAGDGTGVFTGADQPYYQFDEIVAPDSVSAPREWTLNIPATVESFGFLVYVVAEVPFPDGFVDLGADSVWLESGDTLRLNAGVRDVVGRPIGGDPMAFATSDTSVAVVDSTGLITAVGSGQATITAMSDTRPGQVVVLVGSAAHLWVGATSSDWSDASNWQRGTVPAAGDSIFVPVVAADHHYPELTEPVSVGYIEVTDAAEVSLAGFDLTASGNVHTGTTGGILGTGGVLVLTGSEGTLRGILPRARVAGNYRMIDDTRVAGDLTIRGGMLQGGGHRLAIHD